MEHKPRFPTRQSDNDPDAPPKSNSHGKDHIIKYENDVVVSKSDQYYKILAEAHVQIQPLLKKLIFSPTILNTFFKHIV